MMSTKQVVLALLVSAQIASAAEVVVAQQQNGYFGNLLSSGKNVAGICAQAVCENKKPIAAVIAVAGVSAAAYYNWDRVQKAYNRAVDYVKENQETITYALKVGAAVTGVTAVVAGAGYMIYDYFSKANKTETTDEAASVVEQAAEENKTDIADQQKVEAEKKK